MKTGHASAMALTFHAVRPISPLPLGEGQGVRGRVKGLGNRTPSVTSPHPGPLPEGEGDSEAQPDARYTVTAETFQQAIAAIRPEECCTASEFLARSTGRWTTLTFDDGYRSDYEVVLPALARRGLRATFFVTASNAGRPGYTSHRQWRAMADAGMEIASHGQTHRYLIAMPPREAAEEIARSKLAIEEAIGRPVVSFAAVGGHFAPWMIDVAAEAGYRVFATMVPGRTRHRSGSQGLLALRRNHVQAHHDAAQIVRLLEGPPHVLLAGRAKYAVLALSRKALGMNNYDRLRSRILRSAGR